MGKVVIKEHTADFEYEVYADDLEELFLLAAKTLFRALADIEKVDKKIERIIELEADNIDMLLHSFLDELLFLWHTENILFSDFSIKISKKQNKLRLIAKCFGEYYNNNKHSLRLDVKAVTWHNFEIKKKIEEGKEVYYVDVTLDI